MTPEEAAAAGAGSILIGVANVGGRIAKEWEEYLLRAARAGLDVISGLHTPLSEVPGLSEEAARRGIKLQDVRRPRQGYPVATGDRRTGKRLATVGTDCALGKKYTALALTKGLKNRNIAADFRATGPDGNHDFGFRHRH